MKRITAYRYSYNISEGIGLIRLRFQNNQWTNWLKFTDKTEFQIVLQTLQHEKLTFYHEDNLGRISIQTHLGNVNHTENIKNETKVIPLLASDPNNL